MTDMLITEIRVIVVDTETNKKLHVFLYDYFRELCIATGQSFNDFCNRQFDKIYKEFKVDKVKHVSEAQLRFGYY